METGHNRNLSSVENLSPQDPDFMQLNEMVPACSVKKFSPLWFHYMQISLLLKCHASYFFRIW